MRSKTREARPSRQTYLIMDDDDHDDDHSNEDDDDDDEDDEDDEDNVEDEDEDEDEDDDDEDDDQCYLLVSTIANRHYVLLPPHLSPRIYGASCLGSTVSLSVCTACSNGEVVGSIFQIKSHKVFKSLPCLV